MEKNTPKHLINQFLYAFLIKTLNYSLEFHEKGPLMSEICPIWVCHPIMDMGLLAGPRCKPRSNGAIFRNVIF